MNIISTCLSPQLLPLHDLEDKIVVVVDILRATSSMVTALAYDVASITPVASLADCRMYKERGYTTAGERGGQKVDGFDLGNSPFDFMDHQLHGVKLAFTTTNGTQAIALSQDAKQVILGSFLNLSATADYLKQQNQQVLILCAGWKGKFNIEDTLYAGALVHQLNDTFKMEDDASLAASTLYLSAAGDLVNYMARSSHAQRLAGFKNHKDLEFCMETDRYSFNAVLQGEKILKLA